MIAQSILQSSKTLRKALTGLTFSDPVAHVYNPLDYAFEAWEQYVLKFAQTPKRCVLLGMNPGPYGMMQVGVPFGEVNAVRDWMGISASIKAPALQHPKRPIQGFDCTRSEVSGRRVWHWAAETFGTSKAFFEHFFVLNYCPLVWLEASGKNRTPEQLPAQELKPVYQACDQHLTDVIKFLSPQFAVGVGAFAQKRIQQVLGTDSGITIGSILHPSPASPAANRGWAPQASAQLHALGVLPIK
jgi:single-strand selective monofunctional uracil DNA glycosylase